MAEEETSGVPVFAVSEVEVGDDDEGGDEDFMMEGG